MAKRHPKIKLIKKRIYFYFGPYTHQFLNLSITLFQAEQNFDHKFLTFKLNSGETAENINNP